MHAFEAILIVLGAAVLLSVLSRRLNAPFPPFLALAGAGVAFLPFAPEIGLNPQLALALFVAPVLLDAAFDSSLRDLKRNAIPIASLSLMAVGVTVVTVALVARWLEPGLSWPAAVALGAIVAPPDAAAATAVLKLVPAPRRVRTILEGESLFNDASALLIYRFAVVAAVGALPTGAALPGLIAWALIGSVVFGVAIAWVQARLMRQLTDAPPAIVLQFISVIGVWILAEQMGLSAIITVVVFALTVARLSARSPAALRVPSYAVWETVVFALNAMAFMLVGLQIGPIWAKLAPYERGGYAAFALAILATCVLARFAWVMAYNTTMRIKNRYWGVNLSEGDTPPTLRSGVVVAWAGMRGVVSLAAAYALPAAFPMGDLIVLTVFVVVMGTLVIQGLTLAPMLRLFRLGDDGVLDADIRRARVEISEAAIAHVIGRDDAPAQRLLAEYQERRSALTGAGDGDGRVRMPIDDLTAEVLAAKRERLLTLRLEGVISDAAYYQIEEELDRHELVLIPVVR